MILSDVDVNNYIMNCQDLVQPKIIHAIIKNESSFNTTAIAIVGSKKNSTINDLKTAKEKMEKLLVDNKNFSVGLMQVNKFNFNRYNITSDNAFNACKNIKVGASIFNQCYLLAKNKYIDASVSDLNNYAYSCYYSGNFKRGFKVDSDYGLKTSYVERINKILGVTYKNSKSIISNYDNEIWYVFNKINKQEKEKNDQVIVF